MAIVPRTASARQALEAAANEMIRKSLEGVTSMAEKSDILTPWKEQDRRNREVYNPTGVADPSLRKGMYHRTWNSRDDHLNSRDGSARGRGRTSSPSLDEFVEKQTGRPSGMGRDVWFDDER